MRTVPRAPRSAPPVTGRPGPQLRVPGAPTLIVMTGPIGAGKSTVAELLAQRLAATGLTVAVTDLDDAAFSQRGRQDLVEFWRRAGVAHSALVHGWFQAGADVVIAHGPFFESASYERLFAAAPMGARAHHVLLLVSFDVALVRVSSDPERGPGARSTDPEFLASTHEAFRAVEPKCRRSTR